MFFSTCRHCKMDLNTALADAKIAIHLFFNNKFDEAQLILEPWYVYYFKYDSCIISIVYLCRK